MRGQLTVFVNTSDGFEDCWSPFLTLWKKYGGALAELPVALNSEYKEWSHPGLDVQPCRSTQGIDRRLPWSECMIRGLDTLKTPYLLYMQEDYFLKSPALVDVVERAVAQLAAPGGPAVVYLNHLGPQWPHAQGGGEDFIPVPRQARYLLSTQAAVWRVDALRALTCPWENGWSFEKFGSVRMSRRRLPALQWTGPDALDYIYTGVIKGKWLPECVDVFAREGIDVDFSRRGFYEGSGGRLKTRYEVLRKLTADREAFLRSVRSLL